MKSNASSPNCTEAAQSAYDEVLERVKSEQSYTGALIDTLYSRLNRTLVPILSDSAKGEAVPKPIKAEICEDMDGLLANQAKVNHQLQDILSRLAI